MGGNLETIDRDAAESLIDWWQVSGVDQPVSETPRGWLRGDPAPVRAEPVRAEVVASNATSAATERPRQFEPFREWIATASGLPMDRSGAIRVVPSGPEAAAVMVLSDIPDREDAASGRPIGGESLDLLKAMLRSIGIDSDAAYHASLACFHAPGARIGRDELERCADIARDHIRLARPERLILFGDSPARALTGEPLARARGRIHRIEGIRTIATFHPRWLLQRPSDKALAWRDLLLLMSDQD